MRRIHVLLLALTLVAATSAPVVASTLGTTCKKVGITKLVKSSTYVCTKTGSKLSWQKMLKKKKQPRPANQEGQVEKVETVSGKSESEVKAEAPQPPKKFPSVEISLDSLYLNAQLCKLNNKSGQTGVHQGFDQSPYVVNARKSIRAAIVPIDFPELVGGGNTTTDFRYITEGVSGYFSAISDGKINFNWTIFPSYIRYSGKVSEARLAGTDTSGYNEFASNAKKLARQTIDFKQFDLLIFAPPLATTRSQIAFGPAFLSTSMDDINATMLDGQSYDRRDVLFPSTTAHEIGHLMGLADLYNFSAREDVASGREKSFDIAQFKFMGGFDLMNHADGPGVELTAWNRWLLGVLEDSQIRCLPQVATRTTLTAVELEGGIKGAVIPISSSQVIVIESRKPIRYDQRLGTAGVLVYKVDTSIPSGSGPMTLIRKSGSVDALGIDALLREKESLIVGKVKISVLETGTTGDVVEVSYLN